MNVTMDTFKVKYGFRDRRVDVFVNGKKVGTYHRAGTHSSGSIYDLAGNNVAIAYTKKDAIKLVKDLYQKGKLYDDQSKAAKVRRDQKIAILESEVKYHAKRQEEAQKKLNELYKEGKD
jgi:hypothetical protein